MFRLKFNTKKQPKKFAAVRSYTQSFGTKKQQNILTLVIINYASYRYEYFVFLRSRKF